MKIVHVERLVDKGEFSATEEWQLIDSQVIQAIKTIEWPPDSGSFTLYPESGKKRGEGNGVKPIKEACMLHLETLGWKLEQELTAIDTGKIQISVHRSNCQFSSLSGQEMFSAISNVGENQILGIARERLRPAAWLISGGFGTPT